MTLTSRATHAHPTSPRITGFELELELELELIQSHMAQKPMLRGEVGCACVALLCHMGLY